MNCKRTTSQTHDNVINYQPPTIYYKNAIATTNTQPINLNSTAILITITISNF